MDVTFNDWLELLGINEAITGLMAGTATLTEARDEAVSARAGWPSVSQDYVAVLDQLDPFFTDVAQVIAVQQEIVAQFNRAAVELGHGIDPPVDRLLSQADLDQMRESSELLVARFEEQRHGMQLLEAEIADMVAQLDDALGRMERGAESAEQEIADLADEAGALADQMEAEGCLPS